MRKWRCKFGFHRWGHWIDIKVRTYIVSQERDVLHDGQKRYCEDCKKKANEGLMSDQSSKPTEIRVYAFGELEPGTELVLKSAFDAQAQELASLRAENEILRSKASQFESTMVATIFERDKLKVELSEATEELTNRSQALANLNSDWLEARSEIEELKAEVERVTGLYEHQKTCKEWCLHQLDEKDKLINRYRTALERIKQGSTSTCEVPYTELQRFAAQALADAPETRPSKDAVIEILKVKVLEHRRAYTTDIFPNSEKLDENSSRESISAAMGRHMCDCFLRYIDEALEAAKGAV